MKEDGGISLLDGIFIFLLSLSFLEKLFYGDIVAKIEAGKFGEQKPSWAMVSVIVLFLEPYKEILYTATIIITVLWVCVAIYKKWFKKTDSQKI
jgi:hypothetical protein